jgi:6-pyruvoyltetrahydropterin/6-carboxytetrahydropterin synthase
MEKFQSTKLFDGYSCVFRQWKAEGTHCRFLHGYGVSFRVWFEGQLDERNWVWDFGGMKRAKGTIDGMNPKEWMDDMFDHTTIIAEDDPHLGNFIKMWKDGIIQLRIIPATGAEQFAKYIYQKLNTFIQEETDGRVKVTQVEFMEHNKNTAIYSEPTKSSSTKPVNRQPVEGC